ncbi:hypothetical protein V6N11_051848 [Hibiscus sabdariffa]|uniref:Uncharacterized protein n=1 Tax=Hibiscus sabdariffa TaxID=183260 RepID=A0ABR2U888_9ROSI
MNNPRRAPFGSPSPLTQGSDLGFPEPSSTAAAQHQARMVAALTQEHYGGGSSRAMAQGFLNVATHRTQNDNDNNDTRQIEAAVLKVVHTAAVARFKHQI